MMRGRSVPPEPQSPGFGGAASRAGRPEVAAADGGGEPRAGAPAEGFAEAPEEVPEEVPVALGLDAASSVLSVALVAGARVIRHRWRASMRGQAEDVIGLLGEVVGAEELARVDRVAVTVGPGSFTGVRVGLAAAQGLALAIGRPLIGISGLEVVAHSVPPDQRHAGWVVSVLTSRGEDLFAQAFRSDGPGGADLVAAGAPVAMPLADLAAWLPAGPLVLAGDGAARLLAYLMTCPSLSDTPDLGQAGAAGRAVVLDGEGGLAPIVARLAISRAVAPGGVGAVRPLYLREPVFRLAGAASGTG